MVRVLEVHLDRVRDAVAQVGLGEVEAVDLAARRAEVEIGQADERVEAGAARDLPAALQRRAPADVAGDQRGRAHHDVRGGQRLGIVEALGQRDGLAGPAQRLRAIAVQHAQVRLDPIRAPQLPGRRLRLQQRDGLPAGALRLGVAAGAHQRPRHRRESLALLQRVAGHPPARHRLLQRGDRLAELVEDRALLGVGFEQPRPLDGRHRVGEAQGPRVLGGRLAVGADAGGVPRGLRRELAHRLGLLGALGVVGDARQVARRPREQRDEHLAMQRAQARRRDRLEDGLPGELVAKRQPVALRLQHADADARLGRLVDVLTDLGQELGLDPRADDGGGLQQRRDPGRAGGRPAPAPRRGRWTECRGRRPRAPR